MDQTARDAWIQAHSNQELDKLWLQLYRDLCQVENIDLPCDHYDQSGLGADFEADGRSQCAQCGHPWFTHGPDPEA